MAKAIQAPIFHVNGDDPEACRLGGQAGHRIPQQFKVDVMIDLWCYRRHGHNETDEPSFTQPMMYKEIERHVRVSELYAAAAASAKDSIAQEDPGDEATR